MDHLPKLFQLIQLTRSQPQYGYVLSGIPKAELSDLAQHHYLVTFIAWQLARHCIKAGAEINLEKVLELCLIHDLGELFGGDIAAPYANVNPKAKKLAKAFESENHSFMSRFFGDDGEYFKKLSREILKPQSDECIIAKTADYIECIHYKLYQGKLKKRDITLAHEKTSKLIQRAKNKILKQSLLRNITAWKQELSLLAKNPDIFDS